MSKSFPHLLIAFLLLKALQGVAIAENDAPHNSVNNIYCGSCHAITLLSSPFWGNATDENYNNLCLLNCHNATSPPYTDTSAPMVKTHSSANTSTRFGTWSRRCIDCHDPHQHQQKFWQSSNAEDLFLASGQITAYSYDSGSNTSTFTYSTLDYKSGWDAASLIPKTTADRYPLIYPNVRKVGYNFPVIAIDDPDPNTITVKGDVSSVYTYATLPTNFGIIYGQYIRQYISVGGTLKEVKFFDRTGAYSYADGDANVNGICEVCHTQTLHYSPDAVAGGDIHYPGQLCTTCHSHKKGFAHSTDDTGSHCATCHNSAKHVQHLLTGVYCSDCHDLDNMRDANRVVIDPRPSGPYWHRL